MGVILFEGRIWFSPPTVYFDQKRKRKKNQCSEEREGELELESEVAAPRGIERSENETLKKNSKRFMIGVKKMSFLQLISNYLFYNVFNYNSNK